MLYIKKKPEKIELEHLDKKSKPNLAVISIGDMDDLVSTIGNPKITEQKMMIFQNINNGIIKMEELFLLNIGKLEEYLRNGHLLYEKICPFTSGKIFGEKALMNNDKRIGTILITEDSHLAIMKKEEFDHFFSGKAMIEKRKKEFLSIVFSMPHEIIREIAFYFEETRCAINHILFQERSPIRYIYLIKTGAVQVFPVPN